VISYDLESIEERIASPTAQIHPMNVTDIDMS
jgi:hypothetical protein